MGSAASTIITSDIRPEDGPALAGAAIALQNKLIGNGTLNFDTCVECFTLYKRASTTITDHFPGAKVGKDIVEATMKTLSNHHCNEKNTLFAQSVCPDEINHENGDVTTLFKESLGEVFHLGGLAGIPFTGKTGFAAFSHHVPDGGNLFILMAPHIGISESGQLGKYSRHGQECDGAACGAAVGALNYCTQQEPVHDAEFLGSHPSDYQMDFIKCEIAKKYLEINANEDPNKIMAALVKVMYDISKEFLENIVDTGFGNKTGKLIILGGIQINMPPPMTDYFQPLMFEIREHEKPTTLLMDETFPGWPKPPAV